MKQGIVDMHNKYRNQQANGDTPNYEPATRMATMVRIKIVYISKKNFAHE